MRERPHRRDGGARAGSSLAPAHGGCHAYGPRLSVRRRMGLKQVHLFVRGRVQGVFFRASTPRAARRLGPTGWVKTRPEGAGGSLDEGGEGGRRERIGGAGGGRTAAGVERVDARWGGFGGDVADC